MPDIKCQHCGSYNNIREVVTRCLQCNQNLFNQKTNNMKNVFKKGDRVYHIHHGWGKVERISLWIWVKFEKDKIVRSIYDYLLSFTEYRLEGFTQQRSFEPEIGKFYWFWDDGDLECKTVVYSVYKGFGHKDFPYKCHFGSNFQFISDKNPLENDSK